MGVKMFEARYGAGIINLKKYKDESRENLL